MYLQVDLATLKYIVGARPPEPDTADILSEVPVGDVVGQDWPVSHSGAWESVENIPKLEARAAWAELVTTCGVPAHSAVPHLVLCDNMSMALAAGKGRASSTHIIHALRQNAALPFIIFQLLLVSTGSPPGSARQMPPRAGLPGPIHVGPLMRGIGSPVEPAATVRALRSSTKRTRTPPPGPSTACPSRRTKLRAPTTSPTPGSWSGRGPAPGVGGPVIRAVVQGTSTAESRLLRPGGGSAVGRFAAADMPQSSHSHVVAKRARALAQKRRCEQHRRQYFEGVLLGQSILEDAAAQRPTCLLLVTLWKQCRDRCQRQSPSTDSTVSTRDLLSRTLLGWRAARIREGSLGAEAGLPASQTPRQLGDILGREGHAGCRARPPSAPAVRGLGGVQARLVPSRQAGRGLQAASAAAKHLRRRLQAARGPGRRKVAPDFFEGAGGVGQHLEALDLPVVALDVGQHPLDDISIPVVVKLLQGWTRAGIIACCFLAPPCATWSSARRGTAAPRDGPLLSKHRLWGDAELQEKGFVTCPTLGAAPLATLVATCRPVRHRAPARLAPLGGAPAGRAWSAVVLSPTGARSVHVRHRLAQAHKRLVLVRSGGGPRRALLLQERVLRPHR